MENERNNLSEDMAKAAAEWWATKIGSRGAHHDNGDKSDAGFIAGLLADMLNKPADNQAVSRFEEILAYKLQYTRPYVYSHFGCDYGPDRILADAATEAGVPLSNFPWKTRMCIDPDRGIIEISNGYRAPLETIYEEEREDVRA